MKSDGFQLSAIPVITDAYCKKCGNGLVEFPSSFGKCSDWICHKCSSVYRLKLVKVPERQIDKKVLKMTVNIIKNKKRGKNRQDVNN